MKRLELDLSPEAEEKLRNYAKSRGWTLSEMLEAFAPLLHAGEPIDLANVTLPTA